MAPSGFEIVARIAAESQTQKENMEKRSFKCVCEDYVIEVVKDTSRRNEIVDMLIESFVKEETLLKSLRVNAQLSESEESDLLRDERMMMEHVAEVELVLIAIHKKTNRISGTLAISIHHRDQKASSDNVNSEPHEGGFKSCVFRDFCDYADKIDAHGAGVMSLFDKYPRCKAYADFEVIGVNRVDRRKGIALDLYMSAISVIKDIPEVTVISGMYTSLYSRRIAQRIGKVSVSEINLMEFRDKSGKPVFQDTEPHNIISLMAMEI